MQKILSLNHSYQYNAFLYNLEFLLPKFVYLIHKISILFKFLVSFIVRNKTFKVFLFCLKTYKADNFGCAYYAIHD